MTTTAQHTIPSTTVTAPQIHLGAVKTLPQTIPEPLTSEEYRALRDQWRLACSTANTPGYLLRPAHYLLYAALRGRDWRRGLRPPTNPCKVANGALVGWAGARAYATCVTPWPAGGPHEAELLRPFGGLITSVHLQRIRNQLPPQPKGLIHDGTSWCIPAYCSPASADPTAVAPVVAANGHSG